MTQPVDRTSMKGEIASTGRDQPQTVSSSSPASKDNSVCSMQKPQVKLTDVVERPSHREMHDYSTQKATSNRDGALDVKSTST